MDKNRRSLALAFDLKDLLTDTAWAKIFKNCVIKEKIKRLFYNKITLWGGLMTRLDSNSVLSPPRTGWELRVGKEGVDVLISFFNGIEDPLFVFNSRFTQLFGF